MAEHASGQGRRGGRAIALVVGVLIGTIGLVGGPARADSTTTWKNTTAISIPDSGSASPYPSAITVAGAGTEITDLKVVIRNTSHGCAKDLDVLLVGPDGTKTTLFSDNGHAALLPNCSNLDKASITIDDSCPDFSNSVPGGADICVRPSDNVTWPSATVQTSTAPTTSTPRACSRLATDRRPDGASEGPSVP